SLKETSAIYVYGNANTVGTNTATGNAWDGFSILGANNTVTSNTATGNGLDGFDVGEPIHGNSASNTTLSKNTATNNHGDGIRVYDSSAANSITVTKSKVSGSAGKDCVIHDATSLNVAAST